MAQAFSELITDTRKSSLTLDAAGGKGLRAGYRARDADSTLGFKSVRLYDFIYRGSWTLFAFTGTGAQADATTVIRTLHTLAQRVSTFVVSTDSRTGFDDQVLYDLDEEAHRV